MLLTLADPGPRAGPPLAFRAAAAMAAGACAAWAAHDLVQSRAGEQPIVDASPVDHAAWMRAAAACIGGTAALAALLLRRRMFRDWSVLAVAGCVGAILAIDATADPARGAPAPGIVTLDGWIATEPRIDEAGSDELADHAIRQASTSFRLSVDSVRTDAGPRGWAAQVTCRVGGMADLPSRGSRVRVTGWIRAFRPALNPGQRAGEPRLLVSVTSSRSIEELDAPWAIRSLVRVRAAANACLQDAMPAWSDERTRALVQAMTTGVRLPGLDAAAGDFRDAGMSHVLAISGFNVAVLVGAASLGARIAGLGFRARASVAALTALAFLAVTEPDTSVVRAGLGAGLAALASLRGGNARGLGTLGAVAIASMAIDIGCIAGAGFQLSYGVVIALLVLAAGAARRWDTATSWLDGRIARPGTALHEACTVVRSSMAEAAASAAVAWTISTPIALWHGGSVSMLAVPLSIATMPVAAGATIAGVLAMVIGMAWQQASSAAGSIAAACAGLLDQAAQLVARCDCASVEVAPPPWWWCAVALASAWMAWGARTAAKRLVSTVVLVGMVCALAGGAVPCPASVLPDRSLTVDALAVARGSCTVARTDAACIVVNCGSWSSPAFGSRTAVPALRAMGVRSIDGLVILGRGLGSSSAVPELAKAFTIRRVLLDSAARAWIDGSRDAAAGIIRAAITAGETTVEDIDERDVWIGDMSIHVRSVRHGTRADNALDIAAPGIGSIVACTTDAQAAALPAGIAAARPGPDAAARTIIRGRSLRVQHWTETGWR